MVMKTGYSLTLTRAVTSALFLLVVVGVLLPPLNLYANVVVTGYATALVEPDATFLTFTIQTEHTTSPAAAQASNDALWVRTRAQLVTTIDPGAVEVLELKTTYRPSTSTDPASAASATTGGAWVVARRVRVTFKGSVAGSTLTDATDVLRTQGLQNTSMIQPALLNSEPKLDALRKAALEDARRRAQSYATGAGITLTTVLNVVENRLAVPVDGDLRRTVDLTVTWGQK